MHYKYVQGVNMLRFSIVPMEGSGTNEKPPALKRVRGSISAVLSDINKSSNHRFGSCQGVNMLRFLHLVAKSNTPYTGKYRAPRDILNIARLQNQP
jgi:hypothetical protein